MADLTIPQTKQAEKWVEYTGPIPSYTERMDRLAKEAGLTIRRMTSTGSTYHADRILLFYSGTKEQISECKLIRNPSSIRWPCGMRNVTKRSIIRLSPSLEACSIYRLSDERFAIGLIEEKPSELSILENGIEHVYVECKWNPSHIFVGNRETLINSGIVKADMFPDESTEEGREANGLTERGSAGQNSFLLRETAKLDGDRWAFISYHNAIQRHEELLAAERRERRSNYGSPRAWLESKEDRLCSMAEFALGKDFSSIETTHGMRYTADQKQMQSIFDEIKVIAQRIRAVSVRTEQIDEPACMTAPPRKQGSASATDSKFESFMRSALMKPQDDGRTH